MIKLVSFCISLSVNGLEKNLNLTFRFERENYTVKKTNFQNSLSSIYYEIGAADTVVKVL